MTRSSLTHFIIALVFALAAAAGYVLWFLAFSAARDNARAAADEAGRIEREDAAIASAKETIASLESDEAALRAYFLSEADIVPFLEELERLGDALQSRVEVASVTELGETTERLSLALRIEGSFEAVMRTLGAIEYGSRDMRIISTTLEALQEENESFLWVATATFSVASITESP